jgi:hypothetical protein
LGTDTATAIVDTVSALWPGAEVRLRRARRADPAAVAEFAIVPHGRAPRLLVPVGAPEAAARAMLRFSASVSARESVGRLGLSALLRTGTAAFADRVTVHGSGAGSLAEHLAQVVGGPVSFSLGIGTPRVNRKPVLQVFDERSRCIGFAKIGDSDQARRDVRAEARSLERIGSHPWTRLQVPRLIHEGTWTDMVVLLQSALPTSPRQRPRDQWTPPRPAMDELADAFAASPATLGDLPWFEAQRSTVEGLQAEHSRDTMRSCLAALENLSGSRPWPVGAWHGDWTPWNMARVPGAGHVQLWDWERFETGVPRGIDRFHYLVNAVTRRDGTTPATIRSGLVLAGADAARAGSAEHTLAGLYLLAVAARYLPLSEGPGGEDIASRATAVVEALHDWVGIARHA